MVQRMFAYQITDGDFFKLENLRYHSKKTATLTWHNPGPVKGRHSVTMQRQVSKCKLDNC